MKGYESVYRIIKGNPGVPRITLFDRGVLSLIVLSVILAVAESEYTLYDRAPHFFDSTALVFGIVFLIEYILRVYASKADPRFQGPWGRLRYMGSFWALVDLFALLPILAQLGGATPFLARLFRIFRILRLARLGRYSGALDGLVEAVKKRRFELTIAFAFASFLLLISASGLYMVEASRQPEHFGSIPRALWWSVATLTTVGYGDVTPITVLGKILAGITAVAGIGLIAMPTGILAAAFSEAFQKSRHTD